MSASTLRVELPAYSHSFQVQVTPSATVRDVKHEIAKVCPGSPSPEGQRLVWRGRFLSDEEKVEDVWKSPEDSRVVHLAVHPSAWSSAPPPLPSAAAAPSSTHAASFTNTPRSRTSAGQPTPTPASWQAPLSQPYPFFHLPSSFSPVAYIQHLHNTALGVLSAGGITLPAPPAINDIETWRIAARDLYHAQGWTWPDVFEQPFPSGNSQGGAVYEAVTLEGLPYLRLTDPNATPTPAQLHALRVLSHTFSILSMANDPMLYVPASAHYPSPYATATNVNQHLHHLGFPQLRLAHAQGANPNPHDANNPLAAPGAPGAEIRAIPVRALVIPLVMLAFRTLLLLYFFSPSKRPLFGVLLSVWILYEAWNAMRLVLNDGNDRAGRGAANPGAAGAGQPAAPAGGAVPNGDAPANNAAGTRSTSGAILDWLSTLNLATEDAILDADAPVPEPGPVQKAKMFFALFFVTLWPSAWDRRRNALRRREGRIRTEANAREAAIHESEPAVNTSAGGQDGEQQQQQQEQQRREEEVRARQRERLVARHERKPAWLKEYVQRVQYTEWVDDA
ncbi:hypothetical protein DICSQDRAFT_135104 [Dichomitus squalens LYAD-421 SS1]|uniref:uncharacterized protein n=1 Tax=Dichomitus squalens (strain LYAD-421) TaxID=732165 RepID=UPI00044114E7|nr:uncharacterized protein DICSQDRAFT_135104 [Dichomitus squalens LYAD-421 SS1]EJF62839.1 hypothetical protein DICSQDRAFT_135104 [Dichomitus squalens LYAD-421 SS1]